MVKFSPIFHFFFIAIFMCNWISKNSAQTQGYTLKVAAVLNTPYVILKESTVALTGNDQFEGYAVDLLQKISEALGFNYTIYMVSDNQYGNLNKESGKWDGMVRDLLDQSADITIGDLTITSERENAVDFSTPFMYTGISILYERPHVQPPSLFAFMAPFSVAVWICIVLAWIGVSVLLWILARFTPALTRHQDKDESEFSLINCMLLPRALSTRLVAGTWWFFVLIMVSIYSYNCAAFATVERVSTPIKSVQDLAAQTEIKYGVLKGGSTESFFRNADHATYQTMWKFMESSGATAFPSNYDEGIERVINGNGNYALLMESASIEYIIRRKCELAQVGGLLDTKSYGIAMRKHSQYRTRINKAIFKLHEDGTLHNLKTRWWNLKRGGSSCSHSKSSSTVYQLCIENVRGVFVVLMIGLAVACIIAVGEHVLEKRKERKI